MTDKDYGIKCTDSGIFWTPAHLLIIDIGTVARSSGGLWTWALFGIMTNFLASWCVLYFKANIVDVLYDQLFIVLTFLSSFREQNILKTYFLCHWHHDIFLTSWQTVFLTSCPAFVSSWHFFSSFPEQYIMKTCAWCYWHYDIFLTSWQTFDVMTNLLSSCHVFDIMTNFLMSWQICWRHDMFLTSWRIVRHFLTIVWHHNVFLTS